MCPISEDIIKKFIYNVWKGLTKYNEFIVVDKMVTKYKVGTGPTFVLIIKNLKTDKYYKVEYTEHYNVSIWVNSKLDIKPIIEVYPEKKEILSYVTDEELLNDILKKESELVN